MKITFFVVLIFFIVCFIIQKDYFGDGHKKILSNSINIDDNYWVKLDKLTLPQNGKEVTFIFVDNKLPLDDKNLYMSIYFNNIMVYKGPIVLSGKLYFSSSKLDTNVSIKIEVLNHQNKTLTILQNKSIVSWNNKYKYLYIFLPCYEQNIYEILFFPQENIVIQ